MLFEVVFGLILAVGGHPSLFLFPSKGGSGIFFSNFCLFEVVGVAEIHSPLWGERGGRHESVQPIGARTSRVVDVVSMRLSVKVIGVGSSVEPGGWCNSILTTLSEFRQLTCFGHCLTFHLEPPTFGRVPQLRKCANGLHRLGSRRGQKRNKLTAAWRILVSRCSFLFSASDGG